MGDVADLVSQNAGEFARRQVAGKRVGDGDHRIVAAADRKGVHQLGRNDIELGHRRQAGAAGQFGDDADAEPEIRAADTGRALYIDSTICGLTRRTSHIENAAEDERVDDAGGAAESPGGDGEQHQAAGRAARCAPC